MMPMNDETIEKVKEIVSKKSEITIPKNYDIYEFLTAFGFKGEKFLSPNAGIENGNFYVYTYYNPRLNVEVSLYFNKITKKTNASMIFYDYNLYFDRLSISKLVEIIKEITKEI